VGAWCLLVVPARGSEEAAQLLIGGRGGSAVGVVNYRYFEPVGVRVLVLVEVADPVEVLP